MTKFSVNSECGQMVIDADSIESAKETYNEKHHYDFDTDIDSSWYEITNYETGEVLESYNLAARPN